MRVLSTIGFAALLSSATSPVLLRGQAAGREPGTGHIIDRETLTKYGDRSVSTILARMPGVGISRGAEMKAWAYSRSPGIDMSHFLSALRAPSLDATDELNGARRACYLDAYVNGVLVYHPDAAASVPLFNVDSLRPKDIERIEVYSVVSQVPEKYRRTSPSCGAMVIRTR